MKPDEHLLSQLKDAVALKFKSVPKTPTDFDLLAVDILARTGRTIGVSTLKRLWGYVKVDHGVTFSTLSLLCRYIGVGDWDAFCARIAAGGVKPYETSGFDTDSIIICDLLPPGAEIEIEWLPDKRCTLRKTAEPDTFTVTASENIKLHPGDTAEVKSLAVGHPFHAALCRRGDTLLGNYTGALAQGIAAIKPVD